MLWVNISRQPLLCGETSTSPEQQRPTKSPNIFVIFLSRSCRTAVMVPSAPGEFIYSLRQCSDVQAAVAVVAITWLGSPRRRWPQACSSLIFYAGPRPRTTPAEHMYECTIVSVCTRYTVWCTYGIASLQLCYLLCEIRILSKKLRVICSRLCHPCTRSHTACKLPAKLRV